MRWEREIRVRDKAEPIFILQSNYQSFPILNLPRALWCDWIPPQAWQQFSHHTSPASKPCTLPHLGSHWDTCAAEPACLPPPQQPPAWGAEMGTPFGTPVCSWEGGSPHQPQRQP